MDGLWTLGDPQQAPEVIAAYRASCEEHGRHVAEIILQTGIAWAKTDEAAVAGARRWKPTQLPSVYRDDIRDPLEMQRLAAAELTDAEFAHEGFVVSADVEHHLARLRGLCSLEPSVICTRVNRRRRPAGDHPHLRPAGAPGTPRARRADAVTADARP